MFVTPLTGSGETIEVTEFLLGYFVNLAFSPDGKEIFFDRADNWTSDDWAIFVVSLDENPPKPRKLEISIDRPYFAPHPLPNGKGLIFLASSDLLFGDVYKLDYMSNTIKGLSGKYGETNATALKVSQDGGIVAYDAQIGEDSDIFVAYLNADSLVRLTSDPEDEWLLDLSPDGEFILFDRENSKKGKTYADLFIMKTDGTSERRLTNKEIWASARFIPDSKLKIEK